MAKPKSTGPTPAQQRILTAIRTLTRTLGFPPTYAEIGRSLEISAQTVLEHCESLRDKGLLTWRPETTRTLRIVEPKLEQVSMTRSVPILGAVVAGRPVLAEQNAVGAVDVDARLVRGECFALRVRGESMRDVDIRPDDIAIVQRQQTAKHNEIIVAMLDGETTLKRFQCRYNKAWLKPENREFENIPITPDCEFAILGKVVAITRRVQ